MSRASARCTSRWRDRRRARPVRPVRAPKNMRRCRWVHCSGLAHRHAQGRRLVRKQRPRNHVSISQDAFCEARIDRLGAVTGFQIVPQCRSVSLSRNKSGRMITRSTVGQDHSRAGLNRDFHIIFLLLRQLQTSPHCREADIANGQPARVSDPQRRLASPVASWRRRRLPDPRLIVPCDSGPRVARIRGSPRPCFPCPMRRAARAPRPSCGPTR